MAVFLSLSMLPFQMLLKHICYIVYAETYKPRYSLDCQISQLHVDTWATLSSDRDFGEISFFHSNVFTFASDIVTLLGSRFSVYPASKVRWAAGGKGAATGGNRRQRCQPPLGRSWPALRCASQIGERLVNLRPTFGPQVA